MSSKTYISAIRTTYNTKIWGKNLLKVDFEILAWPSANMEGEIEILFLFTVGGRSHLPS